MYIKFQFGSKWKVDGDSTNQVVSVGMGKQLN